MQENFEKQESLITQTIDTSNKEKFLQTKIKNSRRLTLFGIFGFSILVLIGMLVWRMLPHSIVYDSNSEIAKYLDGDEKETENKPTIYPKEQLDTSDWKSFESKKLNVTFWHPKDWNVQENSDGVFVDLKYANTNGSTEGGIQLSTVNIEGQEFHDFVESYYFNKNPKNKGLDKKYIEDSANKNFTTALSQSLIQPIDVKALVNPGNCARQYLFALLKDSNVLILSLDCPPVSDEMISEVLSSILNLGKKKVDLDKSVPIYPNSVLTDSEETKPCSSLSLSDAGRARSYYLCNSTIYKYTNSGSVEDVTSWYENDSSKSGWKLSGGAGDAGAERFGTLSNGVLTYWLKIKNGSYEIRVANE